MPLIKRYPNRKLYNTSSREYVTLMDIAGLIRQGEEIRVVDHATGEDLTVLTLVQVLFEQAKQRADFLPRAVLTALIQAGENRIEPGVVERVLAEYRLATQQEVQQLSEQLDALVVRLEEYSQASSPR